MSYCRWSSPVPELTPDVDLSFEKMMEIYEKSGYDGWKKYLDVNEVITSDAYVYEDCYNSFVCHWKDNEEDISLGTAEEMAQYLIEKRSMGKIVPESAIQALLEEEAHGKSKETS